MSEFKDRFLWIAVDVFLEFSVVPYYSILEAVTARMHMTVNHPFKRITEARIFLISLSTTFLIPKILRFHLSTENSLTWAVKCEKSIFRKS